MSMLSQGNIDVPTCVGTNRLIQMVQLVIRGNDIIEEYTGWTVPKVKERHTEY